ncbi:hypothetical protein Tco_0197435 [Tanacetum coccineum]
MTTPHPTPFHATALHAEVFTPFVIICDSDDEITTLPIRLAPPSPDHTPTLYSYPLDSGDDSSDEDLSYRASMNRWRAAPSSTWYPLLLLELPFSSRRRTRPLSPSLPPSVPPPPEHTESVRDNIEASNFNLERYLCP